MPAVNTFAIYASVAIFLDFVFQITAFLAFLSLDSDRFQVTQILFNHHYLIPLLALYKSSDKHVIDHFIDVNWYYAKSTLWGLISMLYEVVIIG